MPVRGQYLLSVTMACPLLQMHRSTADQTYGSPATAAGDQDCLKLEAFLRSSLKLGLRPTTAHILSKMCSEADYKQFAPIILRSPSTHYIFSIFLATSYRGPHLVMPTNSVSVNMTRETLCYLRPRQIIKIFVLIKPTEVYDSSHLKQPVQPSIKLNGYYGVNSSSFSPGVRSMCSWTSWNKSNHNYINTHKLESKILIEQHHSVFIANIFTRKIVLPEQMIAQELCLHLIRWRSSPNIHTDDNNKYSNIKCGTFIL